MSQVAVWMALGAGLTLLMPLAVVRLPFVGGPTGTAPEVISALYAVEGDKYCEGILTREDGTSWRKVLAGPVKSNDDRWRLACFFYPRPGTTGGTDVLCVVVDNRTLEVTYPYRGRSLRDGESEEHFECGGGVLASWLEGAPVGLGALILAGAGWFVARRLLRSRESSVPS